MNKPVVVISGATGAAAASAARAFAGQGASLALLSSNRSKLDALTAELNLPPVRLLSHAAELRSPEAVRAAATFVNSKFGRADILLNLVGGWTGGKTLAETPAEDLETMVAQHLWTTFYLVQAFTPGMVHNGWGRVIVVSSPIASQPAAKMGAYAIGKAAEEALLLTLAQEFKDSGVTANIIQVRSIDSLGNGKGTSLEEITSAMLYLCSDEAARINGARIPLY
jgi:NAD(P)-dependent dehydrogenase (short-subunit alcohol dehydrogenase family)